MQKITDFVAFLVIGLVVCLSMGMFIGYEESRTGAESSFRPVMSAFLLSIACAFVFFQGVQKGDRKEIKNLIPRLLGFLVAAIMVGGYSSSFSRDGFYWRYDVVSSLKATLAPFGLLLAVLLIGLFFIREAKKQFWHR